MNKKSVDLKLLSSEELLELESEINEELRSRSGTTLLSLDYDKKNKTVKSWVARVDENGNILCFIDPIAVKGETKNKGVKIFELKEGTRYRICESNSSGKKSIYVEHRYDAIVSNGKLVKA